METNQATETKQTRHERAWAAVRAHLARKREAEQKMVDDFHTDPVIQAAVAELRRRKEERGTAKIPV